MMYGIDWLGGAKYPEIVLNEHPQGFAAGFFHKQFGPALPLIKKLLATDRCPRIRDHIIWEDNHTYVPARHDPLIMAGVRELNALKALYPQVDIQVSPFCEHRITGAPLVSLFTRVRSAAQGLTVVNSPAKEGGKIVGLVNETHSGLTPLKGSYNFSYDGLACVDSNVERLKAAHAGCDTFYLWEPRFNGRWESNDKTPIALRKGWPDARLCESVVYLSRNKGSTNLARGWLYKSHSENKGGNDPRAEMPVLISPLKTRQIDLVAIGGQVVATLPFYGTYADGRYRYYARDWGFHIAEKASRIQSYPMLRVRAGNKFYGTINPAFREGEWRDVA